MLSKRRSEIPKKHDIISEKTTETSSPNAKPTQTNFLVISKFSQADMKIEEFEQLFFENKLKRQGFKISRKYCYMYSENYQNIEKLLTSVGKSFKGRSIFPEFQIVEQMNRKKIEKKKKENVKKKEHRDPYLTGNFKNRRNKQARS